MRGGRAARWQGHGRGARGLRLRDGGAASQVAHRLRLRDGGAASQVAHRLRLRDGGAVSQVARRLRLRAVEVRTRRSPEVGRGSFPPYFWVLIISS